MKGRLALSLNLLLACSMGAAAPLDHQKLAGHPDAQARVAGIAVDLRAEFEAAMNRYAQDIAGRPYDVVTYVERCRFVEQFSWDYEYVAWIEELYERSRRCAEALAQQFPGHPEVELLRLERLYGEEQLERGKALLARLPREDWTFAQASRLYAMLAATADRLGKSDAGDYAVRALSLDRSADVRLIAAAYLVEQGDTERAIEVLTSPFDGHAPGDGWYVTSRMLSLARVGAHEEVLALYSALRAGGGDYNHADAARALREAGATDRARAELALWSNDYSSDDERERFRFELEHGSGAQAAAAYRAWRALGWEEDPAGINRVALFLHHPALPWRPGDVLGLLGAVAAIGIVAVFAWIPVSFVHYRGLARRAGDGAPYPREGWQLRHAWAAMFAFGLASFITLYTAGPLTLLASSGQIMEGSAPQVAQATLAEMFLNIAVLLPLCRIAAVRQPSPWNGEWSAVKCLLVGAALALLLRAPLIAVMAALPDFVSNLSAYDPLWELMGEVRGRYGIATALWIVAMAAPVVEEFVFRGVLLRAFSGHVSFGWANTLQAGLFAAAHVNLAGAPMLFVFGLTAGWLARRSGGLLAPMTLHALFNAILAVPVLQGL
ncbi:MAG TPA: CPBP family intramembrane glutamic endopeptidase [Woeseiaceae bacterium]|nr:CPBP family intramembrane glutamic endopeptidase [Woeseiaceae bacterium]